MSKDAALAIQFPRRSFELGKYLPFRLTVLSNRLTRRVARFYGERFKLSAPEWRTMAVLGQHGAMSANAVIAQTTMDKVRVSRAVAKLLKSNLITREADPQDRRRAILDLTPAGRDIYRQIVPLVQEVEAEITSALTDPERATLDNALAKMEAYLEQSGIAGEEADEDEDA
ncbi:MAG TPA: MarR family winged helix-turn-helix transcriptional regulator [Stellaceae bacterium]|nr:MarR family winged helix-turn-helix transcriptional regulator [Stellaceae bacterium]